ncbi:MAG TPA: N-acetylgalactosamine 6-sulfate sulfatase, partial [Planctomycetota bacterium]|nr:N-acetylgalactosamine 6-sulfate sulfatase [Planctomycetota bacterium]
YPTLLEITGVRMKNQPPLDGVSLVSLIDGTMTARPRPMMFWKYPEGGIATPSAKLMGDLLRAQQAGKPLPDDAQLCLDAADVRKQYPEDVFPGHAAMLDWPWKLHRIAGRGGAPRLEFYNLADDPDEKRNAADDEPARTAAMKPELEKWQLSVVRSLNGADYH